MIHQWEIFHYPSDRDSDRYRFSLWSDGLDVAKVRNIFPNRVGAVWVPRRKPYNSAFFVYSLTPEEKIKIEAMLSGQASFPDAPTPFVPAKAADPNLTKEDTQEVILIDAVAGGTDSVSIGLGVPQKGKTKIRLGYFVPEYLPGAGDMVHSILEKTLQAKKVSVNFEKVFAASYLSLSLAEIHRLLKECEKHRVTRVVAVGETAHMHALRRIAVSGGVFVQPLAESVLDKNLWLTIIAEIISYE